MIPYIVREYDETSIIKTFHGGKCNIEDDEFHARVQGFAVEDLLEGGINILKVFKDNADKHAAIKEIAELGDRVDAIERHATYDDDGRIKKVKWSIRYDILRTGTLHKSFNPILNRLYNKYYEEPEGFSDYKIYD